MCQPNPWTTLTHHCPSPFAAFQIVDRITYYLSLSRRHSLTYLLTYYLSRPTNFNIRVEHVREMRFPSATIWRPRWTVPSWPKKHAVADTSCDLPGLTWRSKGQMGSRVFRQWLSAMRTSSRSPGLMLLVRLQYTSYSEFCLNVHIHVGLGLFQH